MRLGVGSSSFPLADQRFYRSGQAPPIQKGAKPLDGRARSGCTTLTVGIGKDQADNEIAGSAAGRRNSSKPGADPCNPTEKTALPGGRRGVAAARAGRRRFSGDAGLCVKAGEGELHGPSSNRGAEGANGGQEDLE